MRVLHVTHSFSGGGAAIAARQIFEATRTQPGIDAHLMTTSRLPEGLADSHITYFKPRNQRLNTQVESIALRLQKSINPAHRSLGLFASGLARQILQDDWDIVHLHWVGFGTLSIKEIGAIARAVPTVWTLHDSWPFCGADHHPHFEKDERFRAGYVPRTRLPQDSRYDLDAATFRTKERQWLKPITLIAPSTFMEDHAKHSTLAATWPVAVIPHPLDSSPGQDTVTPSRTELALRARVDPGLPIVAFASSSGSDFNKGVDLLAETVRRLKALEPTVQVVALGDSWPELGAIVDFSPGHLNREEVRQWFSAADAVLVTSRIESFSLVAAEAQAAGTPVVAFSTSGLLDVVVNGRTGFLVQGWDTKGMASAVREAIRNSHVLGEQAAIRARELWSPGRVGALYREAYKRAIAIHEPH